MDPLSSVITSDLINSGSNGLFQLGGETGDGIGCVDAVSFIFQRIYEGLFSYKACMLLVSTLRCPLRGKLSQNAHEVGALENDVLKPVRCQERDE